MCRYFPGEPVGKTNQRAPPPVDTGGDAVLLGVALVTGEAVQLDSDAHQDIPVDISPVKINCWKAAIVTVNYKACVRPVREATPPTVSTSVTQKGDICGSESSSSDRIKLRGEPT
jgi:hypothetical protein